MLGVNSTVVCSKNALHFLQVTVQGSLEKTAIITWSVKVMDDLSIVAREGHVAQNLQDPSLLEYERATARCSNQVNQLTEKSLLRARR